MQNWRFASASRLRISNLHISHISFQIIFLEISSSFQADDLGWQNPASHRHTVDEHPRPETVLRLWRDDD